MAPCTDCGKNHGWLSYSCPSCKRQGMCYWCVNHAQVVTDPTSASKDELATAKTKSVCRHCFRKSVGSNMDMSIDVEVIGPAKGTGPSLVVVHGAGASRALYRPHCRRWAADFGIRCVLLDLPGHGSLFETVPYTTQDCIDRIVAVTKAETEPFQGKGPVYLGGSLGGFIGWELLGQHSSLFSAAVIISAAQTVGTGAGLKARAGLVSLSGLISVMSAASFASMMINVASKSKTMDRALLLENIKGGFYFHDADCHIAILRGSDPLKALKTCRDDLKILLMDGSCDHRDNEKRLCDALGDGRVKRIVYEGGDHFFSHDTRFVDQFIVDVADFVRS